MCILKKILMKKMDKLNIPAMQLLGLAITVLWKIPLSSTVEED